MEVEIRKLKIIYRTNRFGVPLREMIAKPFVKKNSIIIVIIKLFGLLFLAEQNQ